MKGLDHPAIYTFGGGSADGNAGLRDLLGGKGANLAEMARIGLPVPPGFTLTTEVCVYGMQHGGRLPDGLEAEVDRGVAFVEGVMGTRFGNADKPLLLSVRSGARDSMPGMMDTVLNIGLNDETVAALAAETGDERFAWDCYRRFVQMYSNVVMGVDGEILESRLTAAKRERGLRSDVELGADDWRALVAGFREAVRSASGEEIPDDPRQQLTNAIRAVFESWNVPRAVTYRKIHRIPDDWGTAANVMAMVFGNRGNDCGTGVVFTRNPANGERAVYGEFLQNAQGEDVVAGIRTPGPLSESGRAPGNEAPSLEVQMPELHTRLTEILAGLERHYRDVQDVEFTIERGKLWILQTRSGKRTGAAAVKIALDLLDEGIVTSDAEALALVDAESHLTQLLHVSIDPAAERPPVLVSGLAASPGAAAGQVVFNADAAEKQAADGHKVILVRRETAADDVHGMHAAKAILTATGGLTSHAAVVARSMGVPCVAGAGAVEIAADHSSFRVGEERVAAGDWITVDGTTGTAYLGRLPMVDPEIGGGFARFMEIADRHRRLGVRANADTPEDARRARELGAEGIGLCRTEHMFFATDERLGAMRELILAESDGEREAALERLLPFQRDDFTAIFREMDGLPVTVRLLDPPLHEFLPTTDEEIAELATDLGKNPEAVARRIEAMHEQNPMLGFRGCRLGIATPEIYRMQARAILEAALGLRRQGLDPRPEIMVPLVAVPEELAAIRQDIEAVAASLLGSDDDLRLHVGTMIELPRAALAAGEIAPYAEFFSFGTNDLTQTTFGLSRDDAGRFLPRYLERGLLRHDPFVSIDEGGVGELVKMACERGRAARPDIHLGICGEHGGDPQSVGFCHRIGLDYVSCSGFRVPGARLAAAQAALA
jgi:pyruvate,orthophosphate dikinase